MICLNACRVLRPLRGGRGKGLISSGSGCFVSFGMLHVKLLNCNLPAKIEIKGTEALGPK